MSVILSDLLLFCCLAAFYTAIVLAAAPAQLTLGGSAPGLRGEAQDRGRSLTILVLVCRREDVPGGIGGWDGHTLAKR